MSDIKPHKHLVKECGDELFDCLDEALGEEDNGLPSSISVPYEEDGKWVRLNLSISRVMVI